MNGRGGDTGAIRDVLLVLLLSSGAVRGTRTIGCEPEVLLLGYPHQIHALLCEEILSHRILSHRPILPAMHSNLPRQRSITSIQIVHQRGEGLLGKHFQVAEITPIHEL